MLCRETLISLAQAIFDPNVHLSADGVKPSETDAKRMLEAYVEKELPGSNNEAARRYAKAALSLANDLQHSRTASFQEAAVCAEATASVVNFIAIVSGHRDPDLHRQLSPKIEMVFGAFPACRHVFLFDGKPCTLFRVGLLNSGGKTIENIRVSLEQIDPQGITFGPIRLLFMNQRQPDEEFRFHPGQNPSLFVDVIQHVRIGEPQEEKFVLPYAVGGVPNVLQPANYRLTLLAEGQDTPSVRKTFRVSWDGQEMGFIEEIRSTS